MIIKKREIPLSILKLQALLRRLPKTHPKVPLLQENLAKRQSGYNGEKALDYPLSFLSEKDYYILHDLRLKDSGHYFQMDTLILNSNFLVIVEVKNISGTVYFDPVFHQLIRTKDGEETAFKDPISQLKRQELHLKNWLAKNDLPTLPILSLVVISNEKTIIRTADNYKDATEKVLHADHLPNKLQQFEKMYQVKRLTGKQIKKACRSLKKADEPLQLSYLEQYDITYDELVKGVFCPSCQSHPMIRVYGSWNCPSCGNKDKDAHILALQDYILLVGTTITNRKLRDFLMIHSPNLATRLLQMLNLPSEGSTRDRIYSLNKKGLTPMS